MMGKYLAALVLSGSLISISAGADLPDEAADAEALREIGAKYVEAFNGRDAAAVAAFWSPEAVYTNRRTGEQVVGREAIAAQFTALFQEVQQLKLEVEVESLEFLSPNIAVETGVALFAAGEDVPEVIPYTAVYLRRGGEWLLDRLTDDPRPEPLPSAEALKAIEWLVGEWVDADESTTVTTSCQYTQNNSFLARRFNIEVDGAPTLTGMQIIGWDGKAKQIRSWTFDSDGGFAAGRWTQQDERWVIVKKGVTGAGDAVSAINIVTPRDDASFTWQSVNRTVAGRLLPNIDEVVIVRQ